MKKLLALLMAIIFIFSFTACNSKNKGEETTIDTTVAPFSLENAEKEAGKFFGTLSMEALFSLAGKDTNTLKGESELFVMLLDAIMVNSTYEILESTDKGGDVAEIKVKLSTPDSDVAIELIGEAATLLEEQPGATEEENKQLVKDLFKQGLADPNVKKNPTEINIVVKYVNGKYSVDATNELILELIDIFFATIVTM